MRLARTSPFLLAFLLGGLLRGPTYAQGQNDSLKPGQRIQLQLANGDRLSGELIWRADGQIRFRSPILGDLTLAESDAALLPEPEELNASPRQNLPAQAASPRPGPATSDPTPANSAPAKEPALAPSGKSASVVPAPPFGLEPAPSPPAAAPAPERWKGKVELGSVQQSGRTDTLSYNARAEAEKKARRHTLRANARALYAEQNNRISADRHDASFRWRYDLSKRTFSQAHTTYYRDEVIQIQVNLEQNLGVGFRVLDQPRQVVNVGVGATAQYREWDAGTNGWAPYAELFQDYTFRINDRITFTQDAVAQYSPSDRAYNIPNRTAPTTLSPDQQNYKVRFNSTLQGKVTERVSVNLRFEFELDNAIQLEDARQTQRITTSLGYAF